MTGPRFSRRRFIQGAAVSAGAAASGITASGLVTAATNDITTENSLPGNFPSEWESWSSETIQGFATDFSVLPGDTINFKIDTASTNYRVRIYRLGYYDGRGARRLADLTPGVTLPQTQPAPLTDAATGLVDCGNWNVSASWQVPANAVSGVYYALFERLDAQNESNHTLFVVRRSGPADVLVQTSEMTMHAYNRYGGNSLYYGQPAGRAYKVSYNRPFGDGVGNENDFLNAEYALARWLERNGYDVAYCAGIDVHRTPGIINGHQVFVSSGHDEYVSGPQRDAVTAARDAGVNLVFMTGNEYFWRVRFEPSIDASGAADRTLVCYKETLDDAKIDPTPEWTGTWRDARFSPPSNGGLPENELTGQLFRGILPVNSADLPIEVPAEYAPLRFWRDTAVAALQPGDVHVLAPNTLGYEIDVDEDNGFRPAGLIRLSSSVAPVPLLLIDEGGTYIEGNCPHNMTMYRAPSGALVWGTGTVQWAYGLDEEHLDDEGTPIDPVIQQATINVLADMGVQPATLQSGMVAASASSDTLPPATTVTSPAPGTVVPVGSPVTVSGTAVDAGGGIVAGVEVSTDGGATWHPATGRASWSYVFIPTALGPIDVQARAVDDSCNLEAIGDSVTLEVGGRTLPCSIWPDGTTPTLAAANDATAIEVGVRFQASADGFISGIRFYKGAGNTGTHVGNLWSNTGSLIASGTFTDETATGWQTVAIAPIAISASQTYVASVFMPDGHYPADVGYFNSAFDLPPMRALANGEDGANGVYRIGSSGFPSDSYAASNYWVDVVFTDDNLVAPNVVDHVPAEAIASVSRNAPLVATFSEAMDPSSIVIEVAPVGGLPVTGSVSYDSGTRSASFTPAGLDPHTDYVATVTAADDVSGNPMAAPFSWTFTTVGVPGTAPASIWDTSAAPVLIASGDTNAVELGVKFTSDVDATITALRYYKAPDSQGVHIGHLWGPTGDLLATAAFTDETASGWQQTTLATPVAIASGVMHTVSYHSPNGVYAVSPGDFGAAQYDNPPLHARAEGAFGGNGVYAYGASSFPTQSWNNTNYWADVILVVPPDTTEPQVTNFEPASGLIATDVDGPFRVTFDEPVDPGSITFDVTGPGGSVPLTVSYDAATKTATATPSASLAQGTVYAASATATDLEGNPMSAPFAWSFTTDTPAMSTLWTHAATPAIIDAQDPGAIEIGVRIQPDRSGVIHGIRFYKSAANTGQHIGHLWTASGNLLGTVTFSNETAAGWQQAVFNSPIAVTGGATYIASYFAPDGHYSATGAEFDSTVQRGALAAPASSSGSQNGVYAYGAGSFPSNGYNATNYWVDVIFSDSSGPQVMSVSPVGGAANIDPSTVITATFDESVQPATVVMELRDGGGSLVSGSTAYDGATRTISFTPTAPLAGGAAYTASVAGAVDLDGNAMDGPFAWSFSVIGQAFQTIWPSNTVPSVLDSNDGNALEVGVKFRSSVAGTVHGVRFYKGGTANTGPHVGNLWAADGTQLATATFGGETARGWQTVMFATPVAIAADTTYVVSYYMPAGHYSVDGGYFNAGPVVSGPITALADGTDGGNGLYRYGPGGGFPDGTYNAGNYWVDVLLTTA